MTTSARDKILATAHQLFYQQGIRAVGVDTIVRESGVTKMTLYRYFPSKDALVVAYLRESMHSFWTWFESVMARHPDSPRQQLEDYFSALGQRVVEIQKRGCPSLNVKTEFPDAIHPARQVVSQHKEQVRSRLRDLLARAGALDPAASTDQLLLLINGAYSANGLYEDFDISESLVQASRQLLDACLPIRV